MYILLEWKYTIEKQQKYACEECGLSYNDSVIEKKICAYAISKASEAIAESCSGDTTRLAKKVKY